MLAAVSVPASAATTRSATPSSPAVATATVAHYSPNIPDRFVWRFAGYYKNHSDCYTAGVDNYTPLYISFICFQTQEYDLIVWEMEVELTAP
jgi:hypothetical protein